MGKSSENALSNNIDVYSPRMHVAHGEKQIDQSAHLIALLSLIKIILCGGRAIREIRCSNFFYSVSSVPQW